MSIIMVMCVSTSATVHGPGELCHLLSQSVSPKLSCSRCNNLAFPYWGAANIGMRRYLAATYHSDTDTPTGKQTHQHLYYKLFLFSLLNTFFPTFPKIKCIFLHF